MTDRYLEIKKRILDFAENNCNIKAVVAIGSSTRSEVKADEFSDLDLIIATENTDEWLYGDIPNKFGDVKISFVEPTLGGGNERRILYDNSLDVDMIVFTPEQFTNAINEGVAGWVCNRGYTVLYDTMNFEKLMSDNIIHEIKREVMTENEYTNMVNNFCFHVVWASKKVLRGELWTAKMCIDSYLKNHLLRLIEAYTISKYKTDVWHDGRFLDRWADDSIKEVLTKCFAHYEKDDMISALCETYKLFSRLSKEMAEICCYIFPETAVNYAGELFSEYFDK